MVIFDAVGPSSAGTSTAGSTTLTWSHTCSGTNRLLTVSVAVGAGTTSDTTSVTYNSVAMTSAGKVYSNNANNGYVEMFYLVAPATGANTVAVTCSASRAMEGGSVSFTGVDQTTPITNASINFGTGTAATLSLASEFGNMTVYGLCAGSNITSSDQDDRWIKNNNTASGAGNGAQCTAAGRHNTFSTTFTITSSNWGIVGMSVNAVATNIPTLIETYSADYTTTTTPKTLLVTSQPGDLIVVYGGGEDFTDTLGTPSGNSISFTLQQSQITTDFSSAYIWSGVDNTGGTDWSLSGSRSAGTGSWGITAYVFRNHAGAGASAVTNGNGAVPTLNITTTKANSAIVVFDDDWNASYVGSRTWDTVNGITPTASNGLETDFTHIAAHYDAYGAYYLDAGSIGTKTVGLSDPSQKYSIVALEVKVADPVVPAITPSVAWWSYGLQPVLRAAATNSANTVSSLGVTIPSTTQVGDMLVLTVAQTSFSGSVLFNAITGWTKQGEQRAGGAAHTIAVFTRLAQSGDAGSTVTSTSINAENYTAQVRVYSNANQLSPLETSVVFSSLDPAALTASAPAISVTNTNTTLVGVYSIPTTSGVQLTASDWTNNAGFVNEVASCTTNTTNNAALVMYDLATPGTGTFGPFSETVTDNRRWSLATIALRSATPLLFDAFSGTSLDPKVWTAYTGTVTGGTLHTTTTSSYTASFFSAHTFDFTNRMATIKTPTVPSAASGEAFMEVYVDANNKIDIGKTGTAFFTNYKTAGVDHFDTSTTYSSTTHLWWRISLENTDLKFYTSPDGITWTLNRTVASGYPTLTNVSYVLVCGHYTSGDPDEPVEFDNACLV